MKKVQVDARTGCVLPKHERAAEESAEARRSHAIDSSCVLGAVSGTVCQIGVVLLAFHAKIFPFQESGSLFKSVVGAVLTPLSNAFEVRLSGTMEKPEWAFLNGPTNFLRSLGEGGEPANKPNGATPPNGLPDNSPPPNAPEKP